MNNETTFLKKLKLKDDYLYQKLEENYTKYLKENKDMNNEYPEAYQQTATFYEWIQSACDMPDDSYEYPDNHWINTERGY